MTDDWPVPSVAAAVVAAGGTVLERRGDTGRVYRLASVTKPLVGYGALLAVQEGALELDQPAELAGFGEVTLRDLLCHASGMGPQSRIRLAPAGTRRIYSNAGYDAVGEVLERALGMPLPSYLAEGVFAPLGMAATALDGSPAAAAQSSVDDLCAFVAELFHPRVLAAELHAECRSVQYPGLAGVLPGFGRQDENDWGLGVEIRGHKQPHWTGRRNSAASYGHFGQSGTFFWVDPEAGLALICLTDRSFAADWALPRWPALSDAVLERYGS